MRRSALLLVAALFSPALASNPGEPLDCSDWVFLEPGLSCQHYVSYPCGNENPWCHEAWFPDTSVVDNLGRRFRIERRLQGQPCAVTGNYLDRLVILAFDGQVETTLGYIDERCNVSLGSEDRIGYEERPLFDAGRGELLWFRMSSTCYIPALQTCSYERQDWIPRFRGFTTTFEILQTYEPAADNLSFRVPYMPEGFQFADWFDTFYGDLATVGDWSQAQPLQCGYPATTPTVGDYLTVADTLPNPSPGHGRYYLTAVIYQGQRRYGRTASGAGLSGRDPAVLPGCAE